MRSQGRTVTAARTAARRGKKLPLNHLDGTISTGSKTISRQELEDRGLTCIPNALWNLVNIFHRAGERVERALDDNEQLQRRLQRGARQHLDPHHETCAVQSVRL